MTDKKFTCTACGKQFDDPPVDTFAMIPAFSGINYTEPDGGYKMLTCAGKYVIVRDINTGKVTDTTEGSVIAVCVMVCPACNK